MISCTRASLVLVGLLLVNCLPASKCDTGIQLEQASSGKLKDYTVTRLDSRIGDIVTEIEPVNHQAKVRTNAHILTFAESADLLYEKIQRNSLEFRCHAYVMLTRQPNVRTAPRVANLINIASKNFDFEQSLSSSVSLSDFLAEGIEYNALSKFHTLFGIFDSENTDPDLQNRPEVRGDMLDCMAYYAERHVKAVTGVREFVVIASERVDPLVFKTQKTEHWTDFYSNQVRAAENAENGHIHKMKAAWLEALDKLFVVMVNNRYRLTREVWDFVQSPGRLIGLRSCQVIIDRLKNGQDKCVKLELESANDKKKSRDYRMELLQVFALTATNLDWLPIYTTSFIYDPARFSIIKRRIKRFRGMTEEEASGIASIDESAMLRGLKESCEILTKQFEKSLNPKIYFKLPIYKARSLGHRIQHHLVGCRVDKTDPTLFNRRRWLVTSVTLKLADWTVHRITDPRIISDQDRAAIIEIARTLP